VRGALFTLAVVFLLPGAASAHPVGFGVLQLAARGEGEWDVLLRVSGSRERAGEVEAVLPHGCEVITAPIFERAPRGVDRRYRVRCPEPLVGDVGIGGIGPDLSMSLRIVQRDGTTELAILDLSAPVVTVEDGARLGGSVFAGYAAIGVEHILTGVDHLLFVLGLLLLLRGRGRALVVTITSFTVGHSITLALATLGVVPIAGPAAEAIIALSILLLAAELTLPDGVGAPGAEPSLTRRFPGLVAGSFGLVHGLGFAGALSDVGLPRGDALTALFAFNVGVEVGQLAFVAIALGASTVVTRFAKPLALARGRAALVYALGGLAAYFVIERVSGFFA
jgi:hypothetical protein